MSQYANLLGSTSRAMMPLSSAINRGAGVSNTNLTRLTSGARRFAHKKHRTVKVELLSDVPGLGLSGSQAEVAPGYMRNYLKPRSLAFYVPRATRHVSPASAAAESVTPTPVLLQPKPELLQLNIAQLAERIASLPTIVLQRRLQTSSDPVESSTESTGTTASGGQLIFGSVTPLDVQKAIEEEHQFLVSNASISFLSGESKLRHTGIATAEVAFRNGSTVFITVDVQGTS